MAPTLASDGQIMIQQTSNNLHKDVGRTKLRSVLVVLVAVLAFELAGACTVRCKSQEAVLADMERDGFDGDVFHGRITRSIGPGEAEFEVIEAFSGPSGSRVLTAQGMGPGCPFHFDLASDRSAVYLARGGAVPSCTTLAATPATLDRLRPVARGERPWWTARAVEAGIGLAGLLLLARLLSRSKLFIVKPLDSY